MQALIRAIKKYKAIASSQLEIINLVWSNAVTYIC